MGELGFSYIGLLYLLMLFIPNIIWARNQPIGYKELSQNENKVLVIFERIGQVLVTTCALIFSNFNINTISSGSIFLLISFIVMLLYEVAWIRYFKKPGLLIFYRRMLLIPCPLATLPILGFLLLGIYGKVIWMIIAVVILGIGHIGIHIMHIKKLNSNVNKSLEN